MAVKYKDAIRMIKVLSWSRLMNLILLRLSFWLSSLISKPLVWGKPFALGFEPTTHCNLRCPECPSGLRKFTRPTGFAQTHTLQKLLDQTHKQAFYLTLYFQGEPFLHPEIIPLIEKAKARRFYVATSSNAHYFTPEMAESTVRSGLDKLIISMDGLEQKTYEKYRIGGNIDTVREGLKNLVNAKKRLKKFTPHIVLQFIAFNHNLHEIERLPKQAKIWGVDEFQIKTAQLYSDEPNDLMPMDEKYSRYKKTKSGKLNLKSKPANRCWRMWSSPVVTQDGQVIPCCFDKDGDHAFGCIEQQDFNSVWKNQEYNGFRNQIFKDRSKIDICSNCTEGGNVFL